VMNYVFFAFYMIFVSDYLSKFCSSSSSRKKYGYNLGL
jgi:hypothetical protein